MTRLQRNGLALAALVAAWSCGGGGCGTGGALFVSPAALQPEGTLVVDPPAALLQVQTSQALRATLVTTDGRALDVTSLAIWTSSSAAVASVDATGLVHALAVGSANITAAFGTASAVSTITVEARAIKSLVVLPAKTVTVIGGQQAFTAFAVFEAGAAQEVTREAAWTSGNAGVATVSAGLASGAGVGSTSITAAFEGLTASSQLVVLPTTDIPLPQALTVETNRSEVPSGGRARLHSLLILQGGARLEVTEQSQWTSSDPAIATISDEAGQKGRLAAVAPGAVQGHARLQLPSQPLEGAVDVRVLDAKPIALAIDPPLATVPRGTQGKLRAMATFTDGAIREVTDSAGWASSAEEIVHVVASGPDIGTAIAEEVGSAVITARLGALAATSTVVVSAPTLQALQVTPSQGSAPAGTVAQLRASAHFSDGTAVEVTSQATWTSSAPAVVQVVPTGTGAGLAAAIAPGTATVTAQFGGLSAAGQVTVAPAALVTVEVTPLSASRAAGGVAAFLAIGHYGDGTTADLTASATWTTSNPAVASVGNLENAGVAQAIAQGTATLTAAWQGLSGTATFTVTAATLTALHLQPAQATIGVSQRVTFQAIGVYSDQTQVDVSSQVAWSCTDATVALLDADGTALGLRAGVATIGAALSGVQATAALEVIAPVLVSFEVRPSTLTLPIGAQEDLTAVAILDNHGTLIEVDVTQEAGWLSSAPAIASVEALGSNLGRVRALSAGAAQISASWNGKTSAAAVTVSAPTLVSLYVDPGTVTLVPGRSRSLAAVGIYSDGSSVPLTGQVAWSSAAPAVASVTPQGLVTGQAAGTTTISAVFGAITGTAQVTVVALGLQTLRMIPLAPVVQQGTQPVFRAIATYGTAAQTVELDVTLAAVWSSDAPAILTIDTGTASAGVAHALAPGTATVSAAIGGLSAQTLTTVLATTLTRIELVPQGVSVPAGLTVTYGAIGVYADGSTADLTSVAVWTSAVPAVASIETVPVVRTHAAGSTTITAAHGGLTGTSLLTVTGSTLQTLQVMPSQTTVPAGTAGQLRAAAHYSDGTVAEVTSQAAWTSSAPAVVQVVTGGSGAGLATALTAGTATVTAQFGGLSSVAQVTVSAATLVSVEVTPPAASRPVGVTAAFQAIGRYSDHTTVDLTASAAWTTSNAAVATVAGGVAQALAQGTATLTATFGGLAGTALFTVTPATLVSLQIQPAQATIGVGQRVTYQAIGVFSDSAQADVSAQVAWSCASPAIVLLDVHGVALGLRPGVAIIEAALSGVHATASLEVIAPTVVSLEVRPSTLTLPVGAERDLRAVVILDNQGEPVEVDVTQEAGWLSSAPAVASVEALAPNLGRVRALSAGTAQISASWSGRTSAAAVTVSAPTLVSLYVDPGSFELVTGRSSSLAAFGIYSDGSSAPLTGQVAWSSAAPAVASVTPQGLVTGQAAGATTISAALGAITGSAQVTVVALALQSLRLVPLTPVVQQGTQPVFRALATYGTAAEAIELDVTLAAVWSSSAPAIVTVDTGTVSSGVAHALAPGTATVTAAIGGLSAGTLTTVVAVPLVRIDLVPQALSVPAGLLVTYAALGVYQNGSTADLTSVAVWTSASPAVASIEAGSVVRTHAAGTTTISAAHGGLTGTSVLTVTAPTLQVLQVMPSQATLPAGTAIQLRAAAHYSNGTVAEVTSQATWTSSAPAVVRVVATGSNAGAVNGIVPGTATVTAQFGGLSSAAQVTVSPAVLVKVDVSPPLASRAAGGTANFRALARYGNNTTVDVTTSAVWNTSNPAVATVGNLETGGVVQALAVGTALLTAAWGGLASNAPFTVTPATLVSLQIQPAQATIGVGQRVAYQAIGVYSDQTQADVSAQVAWNCSDPSIALLDAHGAAFGLRPGLATIGAALSGVNATAAIEVIAPTVVSLEVRPATLTLPVGAERDLKAVAILNNNGEPVEVDVTQEAGWLSSAPAVASVEALAPNLGRVRALSAGAAQISASWRGKTSAATVTVSAPTLVSLYVDPGSVVLAPGRSRSLAAVGIYSDGSSVPLTTQVAWTSAAPAVVSVTPEGVATGQAAGTTTISAALGGVTGSTAVTVIALAIQSLQILPATPVAQQGTQIVFKALATYGTAAQTVELDVTGDAVWTSSAPGIVAIDTLSPSSGVAHALAPGTATVSADIGAVHAETLTTVTAAVLDRIEVVPQGLSVPAGLTVSYGAIGVYSDGSTADLTSVAVWTSSLPAVASFETGSVVRTRAAGATTITAAHGGLTGTSLLTVTAPTLQVLQVMPSQPSVPAGTSGQLRAAAHYSNGTVAEVTSQATWTSSAPAVVQVAPSGSTAGLAHALAAGTATVTAQFGGLSSAAQVTVSAAVLVSVEVTPPSASRAVGGTASFRALGHYGDNTTADVTATATWVTSNPAVASIGNLESGGQAQALSQGTATLTATFEGLPGTAVFTVTPATLVSLQLSPAQTTIGVGQRVTYQAIGVYSDNTQADVSAQVAWACASPSIVLLDVHGTALGLRPGVASIEAALAGVHATASLEVIAPTVVSLEVRPSALTLPIGAERDLKAVAILDNHGQPVEVDVTQEAGWLSSAPAIASVEALAPNLGRVRALSAGTAQVSATWSGKTSAAAVTVSAPTLVSLYVDPGSVTLAPGGTRGLAAVGIYSDGSSVPLTTQVAWTSAAPAVASVTLEGVATGQAAGTTTISAALGAITGSAAVTVIALTLQSLQILPAAPVLQQGTQAVFKALARYGTAAQTVELDVTKDAVWTSSAPAIVAIDTGTLSAGLAHALAPGTATVSADIGGLHAETLTTVVAAVLQRIEVVPQALSVPVGLTVTYGAIGVYSDGSTANLTSVAVWTSSDPAVASFETATLVRARAAGTTTITAAHAGLTATSLLTVTAADQLTLRVAPEVATLPPGTGLDLVAELVTGDGRIFDVSSAAIWVSSAPTIVSVGLTGPVGGEARALAQGSAIVTASLGTLSQGTLTASSALTVSVAELVSISVSPDGVVLAAGLTAQYQATGVYSDGSTADLTPGVLWTSSDPTLATIGPDAVAHTLAPGSVQISASLGAITGETTLTVTPAVLKEIQIWPSVATVLIGLRKGFSAIAVMSDDTTIDVTRDAVWSSQFPEIGFITALALGLENSARGISAGRTQIIATLTINGLTSEGRADLIVVSATVADLVISVPEPIIRVGNTTQFNAQAVFGTQVQDVTDEVIWSTDNPAIATILNFGQSGLIRGESAGNCTVIATLGDNTRTHAFVVQEEAPVSLEVTPVSATLQPGVRVQLKAEAIYADGRHEDASATAVWLSDTPSVATVSPSGEILANAPGTALVTAAFAGVSGTSSIVVTALGAPATIEIRPATADSTTDLTTAFRAISISGSVETDITESCLWTAADKHIANVSNAAGSRGIVESRRPGTTTISAACSPEHTPLSTATLNVLDLSNRPDFVEVLPANEHMALFEEKQYHLIGHWNVSGTDVTLELTTDKGTSWVSSGGVVSISNGRDDKGLAEAVATGTASISGEFNGVSAGTTAIVP